MRFIRFEPGGPPSTLTIDHCPDPKPDESQVVVKVSGFGVNRADTLQRLGKYPPPQGESDILGLEVSGTVVALGSKVTKWELGDAVFGLVPGGGYAERVCVHQDHLMSQPKNMDPLHAAGLAEVFLTAFQSVCWLGQVKKHDRVLIHAGASGVGLAAIQLCKALGAEVAVTASCQEKLDVCRLAGADLLVNYRTSCFKDVVKTNWSSSINTVIDVVGGDYLNRNLSLLALDGRIVYLAMLGGRYADKLDMAQLLGKRAQIIGSTLRNRDNQYKTELTQQFSDQWLDKFESQTLRVNVDSILPVDQIANAHQRLETNDTKGKIIMAWE